MSIAFVKAVSTFIVSNSCHIPSFTNVDIITVSTGNKENRGNQNIRGIIFVLELKSRFPCWETDRKAIIIFWGLNKYAIRLDGAPKQGREILDFYWPGMLLTWTGIETEDEKWGKAEKGENGEYSFTVNKLKTVN